MLTAKTKAEKSISRTEMWGEVVKGCLWDYQEFKEFPGKPGSF